MGAFVWEPPLGTFRSGSFAWELAVVNPCSETLTRKLSFEASLWGVVAWDPSLGLPKQHVLKVFLNSAETILIAKHSCTEEL